ncbi:hypothetical protein H4R34_000072 [Dimargaris verticillata]|uniref:Translation initiation factor eIF 4e-like domain-containing protein n=1 Tax=Dimargaris verticillata TaxID=2761393 RepID=A0A9W8B906_9FUNG|nr:hypothetical protein H4R34_000072 [Dimargaris verticillata]
METVSSSAPTGSLTGAQGPNAPARKSSKLIQFQRKASSTALSKLKKPSGTGTGPTADSSVEGALVNGSGPTHAPLSRHNSGLNIHASANTNGIPSANGGGTSGSRDSVGSSGAHASAASSNFHHHHHRDASGTGLTSKSRSMSHANLLPLASASSSTSYDIHPLQYTWVFSFIHRAPGQKISNYESAMKKVASFSSIEDFWAVYSHLKRPHELPTITDYHLFKQGVRPIWEDDVNVNGGKWIVRLKKGIASRYWENLILAVIGDQFDVGEDICGAVLSIRNSEDILSLWNSSAQNGKINLKIRDTMKRILNLPTDTVMEYKAHNDSMKDNSSFRNTDVYK